MKRLLFAVILFLLFIDIAAAQVCFQGPQGIAQDSAGNTYISDTINNRILKRDTAGTVTVFAGGGAAGFTDGTGTSATFNSPRKIMFSPTNSYLYVADTGNHAIRKISPAGIVSTVSGNGAPGYTNGILSAAKFNSPKGLFVTTLGEIIVADTGNNKLRLINEGAGSTAVSDFAGLGSGGVSCTSLTPGACPNNVACSAMPLNAPEDVVVSTTSLAGNNPSHYYETLVADTGNHGIWALRYAGSNNLGVAFSCVGNWIAGKGIAGYNIGSSQVVEFNQPSAIDAVNYDSSGNPLINSYTNVQNFFVIDRGNHVLRYTHTDPSNPATSYPVAGSPQSSGSNDGSAIFPTNPLVPPASTPSSKFNTPNDIFIKANGNFEYSGGYSFLVLESSNRVRQLTDSAPATANGIWNVNTFMTCGSGTINPVTCASADDTILRLDAPTNAHGEVFNGASSYPISICYSTVFPGSTAPANPSRTCSGAGNRIVRLSSSTNAHAEIPENTNYGTEVCYQGLGCHSVAGNAACGSGEQEVLHLSGATNAHLEMASGTAYNLVSNYKICCSNAPANSLSNPEWRNYNNQQFNPPNPAGPPNNAGNPVCVNQWVIAHAQASGFPNTPQGAAYELWEHDTLSPDDCIAGFSSGCLNLGVYGDISNGQANYPFQLTPAIFAAAGESTPEFYFKAASLSPVTLVQSGIIYASDNPAQCQYQPPAAVITAPVHQGVYFANTPVNFVSGCSSPYGPINYNWIITQGGNQIYTSTQQNFPYTFTNTGQALVTLTCTDTVSSLSATAESQMLVVASPFTFAYIDSPPLNGVMYNSPPTTTGQPYFPTQMSFSGAQSFAVNTNNCVVTCLGGICPTQTQNSPSTCNGNVPGSPSNGQAGGALFIGGTPAPYTTINFDWTFWDNNWNDPWTSSEGSGVHSGTAVYDDMSNSINDKHMSVTATYSAVSGGPTASATFQRDFTMGRCLNNGNTFLSPTLGQQATTGANAVPNACKGFVANNPLDDCCPSGQVCAANGNGHTNNQYYCDVTQISLCSDLTTSTDCGNWANFNQQAPANSFGQTVPSCTYLECYWIPVSGSTPAHCGVHPVQFTQNGQSGCAPSIACVNSDCAWTTQQTTCENGQKTISYVGTPVTTPGVTLCNPGSNLCTRAPITVPCGGLNFELGFFEYAQFIATGIVIALIYFSIGIRRRNL